VLVPRGIYSIVAPRVVAVDSVRPVAVLDCIGCVEDDALIVEDDAPLEGSGSTILQSFFPCNIVLSLNVQRA
jgi:hypothetical protein